MTPQLVLVLCISVMGTKAFTPFQVVDDYVSEFQNDLLLLKTTPSFEEAPTPKHYAKEKDEAKAGLVEEYDFIVVGSGASGSAIASRLTEIPEWRVLLLEAGTAENAVTKVPAMQPYLATTPFTWQLKTVPQNTSCLGTENHECAVGTGKALGGDTATNDMLYTRGHPRDYDDWADQDLQGWCWQSVFPYLQKIEDAFADGLDRKLHHYGGPVHLENFQYSTRLATDILEAAHELGIKQIDYNGKERLGFGVPQVTTKDGRRNSAASAYLAKAYKRKNLIISTDSQVVEVLVSHHTKEANGVTYYRGGQLHVAKAAKEVILSAGAVSTAQLLLLSGIGSEHDLKELNISVVSDLKVGYNLKDHVSFIGLNFVVNNTNIESDGHECHSAVVDYLKYGKGPLTTTGLELVGFLQTEASKIKAHYPDVQLLITRNIYNQGHHHLRHLNIRKDVYDAVWAPLEGKEGFTVEVVLLHPKSTGYVKLHGKESSWHPNINPNSLSDTDDEDVDTILAGIHEALKLVHTEALKKYGVHLSQHQVPGCEHGDHGDLNDEYWRCAIRQLSVNSRHFTGTAKMGPKNDKEAVVDEDLRVYGVHKLRVADSSVIPVSISGNLMAANLVIGEKAADIVKKDWLKEKCQCEL
ncbi:glucose dehydrogenase [FAD, quinone]-like [Anoplophora glabripennis]|uniref:glucose dehydrogenase [FAD, quinone]-like n=1 Tax=Anoplophora glabripennis TaxID=217634 RepID=UPI0008747C27|nr:glucose dehydrogenase [FAD, quinone]-like [Anoplophora glabripennis]